MPSTTRLKRLSLFLLNFSMKLHL